MALTVLAVLLLPSGTINHGDGLARYAQTKALASGSLSIPPAMAVDRHGQPVPGILAGTGGRLYSKYGIGTSLLWVPMAIAGAVAHRLAHVDADVVAGFGISFVNPLIVVFTALSLRAILGRLGCPRGGRASTGAVLLYLFGCSTLPYANTAFSEPLIGLLVLWGCAWAALSDSTPAAFGSGATVAAAMLVKPEMALLAPCLGLCLAATARGESWRPAVRRAAAFAASVAVGVGAILALNLVCRGGPLRFSYGQESSQFRLSLRGFAGYFAGWDRNLFLFNPALIVAATGMALVGMDRRWRLLRRGVVAAWVVFVPFYASWWAWEGGICFGPRFFQAFMPVTMLFAAPPLAAAATAVGRRRWATVATAVGVAATVVLVPLQLAGTEVKGEESYKVSQATGQTEPFTTVKLMAVKIHRGLWAAEVYDPRDLAAHPAHPDPPLDFRAKSTFQYLNNWWLLAIANHVRPGAGQQSPPTAR